MFWWEGSFGKDASGKDVSDEKIWTAVTFLKHIDALPPAVTAEWRKKDYGQLRAAGPRGPTLQKQDKTARRIRGYTKRREISLCTGRRIRRSECGRKSRPATFEMTVRGHGGQRSWSSGSVATRRALRRYFIRPSPFAFPACILKKSAVVSMTPTPSSFARRWAAFL